MILLFLFRLTIALYDITFSLFVVVVAFFVCFFLPIGLLCFLQSVRHFVFVSLFCAYVFLNNEINSCCHDSDFFSSPCDLVENIA